MNNLKVLWVKPETHQKIGKLKIEQRLISADAVVSKLLENNEAKTSPNAGGEVL